MVIHCLADTATSLPGLLDLQFQNICPGPTLTKYIIKTRFLTCQAAEEFITLDTINVVRKYHLPATAFRGSCYLRQQLRQH
ncbi:MAG: hypothetical protein IPM10_07815 [Chitinophagaceae bacterium]|nr:hypothetical protein [Chitinophagaceae bacterium]